MVIILCNHTQPHAHYGQNKEKEEKRIQSLWRERIENVRAMFHVSNKIAKTAYENAMVFRVVYSLLYSYIFIPMQSLINFP